jgi:Zn-dependent protease
LNTQDIANALLTVIIFWVLTTPHEFAHAWVADRLGDDTPRLEGRVTLNPMAHVDLWGTVIIPILTSLLSGGFFGWGRAVNTNPYKLRGGVNGMVMVALAGPASNIIFAVVLAAGAAMLPGLADLLMRAAYLSIFLALFNMIPVPPLDGSRLLLLTRIPESWYIELTRFGFLIIMVLMFSTGLGRYMYVFSRAGAEALYRLFA